MRDRYSQKIKHVSYSLAIAFISLTLAGCFTEDAKTSENEDAPIRGLRTVLVKEAAQSTQQLYPAVLQPAETTDLSFEVGGKLLDITKLTVGQQVSKGEIIARIDDTQYIIDIDNSKAALSEAKSELVRAEKELQRKEALLPRGATTQASVDNARADFETKAAKVVQAEKKLSTDEEDLTKTVLRAPFDGFVSQVYATSFTTVATGEKIAAMYSSAKFETTFSVSFNTVKQLKVDKDAKVILAVSPDIQIPSKITELGDKANSVSLFPITVTLGETNPLTKAGMAVQVALEFDLPTELGFKIPLTAAITDKPIPEDAGGPGSVVPLDVYVFDEASSTVKRQEVKMAGIRDNELLIVEGLEPGDRVASAGVSFLNDGMKVKLLKEEQ